jgi:hypothetical protein
MVTMGFVVKDWFDGGLVWGGKYTTEAKQVIRTHGHITFPVQIHVQIQGQKRRIERCCGKY